MSIDLENMSPQELDALIARAAEAKRTVQKRRINDVRKKLAQIAKDEGYSIEELFGGGRKGGKTAGAIKFANPANPAQTWSGRGKRPNWFKDALAAGASEDSLRVG